MTNQRDLTIFDRGNFYLVHPNTPEATEWLCCHVPADCLTCDGALVPATVLAQVEADAELDGITL